MPSQRSVDWAPRARSDVVKYLTYVSLEDAIAAQRIKIAVDSKSECLVDFRTPVRPLMEGGARSGSQDRRYR